MNSAQPGIPGARGAGSVVLTGASTGIGRASVLELAGRGWHVWAGVRRAEDGEALEGEVRGRGLSGSVRALRFDVTDEDAVAAAAEQVRAAGPLQGLVNNAGIAVPGPLEFLPVEEFRRQLEVNVVGQLRVTQALLPALRDAAAQGRPGRIVFVGSIAGRIAGPMGGAYHASKFALAGLSESLRAELAPWGLAVVLVEPGAIATPIWQRGEERGDSLLARMPTEARELYHRQVRTARSTARRSARLGRSPEAVARVIARALVEPRPKPRRLVGPDARLLALASLLPDRLRFRAAAARRG